MARAPVSRLNKAEIVKLSNWKCSHNHTGLEHYSCWLRYGKEETRVGYWDIEASNLDADFGIMLSYCIKERGKDKYYGRALTGKEVLKHQDKKLIKDCVNDLQKFDVIATYYGTRFDVPFTKARCLFHNIDFPFYGDISHQDIYYIARRNLKISSRRLANVARVILGHNDKTRVDGKYWLKALQGDNKSLNYIAEHNKIDCKVLEDVHNKLLPYYKGNNRSI